MRSHSKIGGIRAWVIYACMLALLLAASVDTGHVCGALRAPWGPATGASQMQSSPGYCPICALAQPATPGVAPLSPAPVMSATPASPAVEAQPHSFQGLFALNVRPPPA